MLHFQLNCILQSEVILLPDYYIDYYNRQWTSSSMNDAYTVYKS